jgi:hypothetical protein
VEDLPREWRVRKADWGQLYLEFQPVTDPDALVVEELAVTMLERRRRRDGPRVRSSATALLRGAERVRKCTSAHEAAALRGAERPPWRWTLEPHDGLEAAGAVG